MSLSSKWGQEITVLDPTMTFENFRFPKSKLNSNNKNMNENGKLNEKATTIFTDVISALSSKQTFRKSDFKFFDFESNLKSVSQANQSTPSTISNNSSENSVKNMSQNKPLENRSKSEFTCVHDDIFQSYNDTALSVSTKEYESDESFMTMAKREKHKYNFINPKDDLPGYSKPLRLFNKNGKPLTDRIGRPLIDILGQPLVVFDDTGRIISDFKGNQVFNSLGESTIYSTTNLYISPSEEEPGIPVLDIDKKHIMFLYDNKGHPLTDVLGRPLIKASGRPMFGINPEEKVNINNYKNNQLKNLYSKAPLENFVRRVQIFDSDMRPLTDESGKKLRSATIICNKNGMPICSESGGPLFFKYGTRISTPQIKNVDNEMLISVNGLGKTPSQSSEDSLVESNFEDSKTKQGDIETKGSTTLINNQNVIQNKNKTIQNKNNNSNSNLNRRKQTISSIINKSSENNDKHNEKLFQKLPEGNDSLLNTNKKLEMVNVCSSVENVFNNEQENASKMVSDYNKSTQNNSKEAIILFDASKQMSSQKSSINAVMMKNFKGKHISHNIVKRKTRKKMYTSNFIEYFKNALNLTTLKQNDSRPIYNDYGKPMRDFYGNLLYDKFGIPLTGANGIQLSEKARHVIRLKLRNIPILPVSKEKVDDKVHSLNCNESHNQFGEPFYDKHGRPLYDLFGKLIYDIYGRPLTDAFGRPLIDAIGQPLMDSQGNVLTSVSNSTSNYTLTDIFGRHLYDKRGRALFDSYGRPRYDIYTNAVYDNCGRPATDGNGNVQFDFLNKPIQSYPEKPLYKNAKALLPKYIDKVLTMPSMLRVLKYSRASLKDIFGGPLFDDFGRPLYNKLGKPLYDKYGRPLYDKDGRALCDCYGRPLSEEIRHSLNDQTLSVVDSLKLLKLTKESSKWMEIKKSQTQNLKSADSGILDNAIVMKVVQPAKKKATQYTYALTRVTRFACGRQAMEILEAPLSPSTATEMHHLPVDNKPLIMVERRRHKIIKKHRLAKYK